jgi:hypothetical protein
MLEQARLIAAVRRWVHGANCASRRSSEKVAGLKVTTVQQRVDVPEAAAPEPQSDSDAQQLARLRLNEVVERRRGSCCRRPRLAAELLELLSAVVSEDRHQGQDEVVLVELDPLGVDPDEHLGHLLFVDRAGKLHSGERVVL